MLYNQGVFPPNRLIYSLKEVIFDKMPKKYNNLKKAIRGFSFYL